MTARAGTLIYPAEGFGAPKDREGHATGSAGLPAGTEVFSADNHISLSEDIFYENFPASMKDQAPRVIHEDGAWTLAIDGKGFLPREFTAVLHPVRPVRRRRHQRPRGPGARARIGRRPPRAGLPQRVARVDGLARQGDPRALLPDLQPAHRRAAGALERPLLRASASPTGGTGTEPARR